MNTGEHIGGDQSSGGKNDVCVVAPSLISLCEREIRAAIRSGLLGLEELCELPSHLVDSLLQSLDPLGLESLQPGTSEGFGLSGSKNGVKRGRLVCLSGYWKTFLTSRWPAHVNQNKACETCKGYNHCTDWQRLYWELHLQSCLDEASERALLPGFHGQIREIIISDRVIHSISYTKDKKKDIKTTDFCSLDHHCQRFGHYARCLRLRNVLCTAELLDLLSLSNLQHVVFCNVKAELHVNNVCHLLAQQQRSLMCVEFLRCTLPWTVMNKVLDFIGKSLLSLKFCETQLDSGHAKLIFKAILKLPSSLSILEISDSNMKSWQYDADHMYKSIFPPCPRPGASFRSLRLISTLNLRGNELDKNDALDLRCSLVNMQSLSCLNLSDNPFTDDGVRILIPYFVEAMEKALPLIELKLDGCHLSSEGVNELLTVLSKCRQSLKSLSIAFNDLGRSTAWALARFLKHTDVRILNIEDINFGPLGFKDLESELQGDLPLFDLNISKNRGGIGAASCISKLISHSPELVALTACHNLMPPHSVDIICHSLQNLKGKLRTLDLTGNWQLHQATQASKLAHFFCQGNPIVVLPSAECHAVPYDDDP